MAVKTLVADGDQIGPLELSLGDGYIAGVQYGTGGTGTIVLEGSIIPDDWFAIGMSKSADGSGTANLAAAGAAFADVSHCDRIRVRLSGAGNVQVGLTVATL